MPIPHLSPSHHHSRLKTQNPIKYFHKYLRHSAAGHPPFSIYRPLNPPSPSQPQVSITPSP
ncbi:uncharacterized protein BDZ99DRAFT_203877 [Mytilinidion resinicola]|uniref:Uncharacterized protein n=1 Tax=Mytilinidion resinicola TaxID=574789 RepID=A0A6A6Y353_9PEZI|nr:uncharacterized protein BDZ99DRAFT_203877 [Mytilinidion resinicola]KAF2802444.1 hypothetical protein BDZ99DRAFT_203877 [Mytilinidion resinicola]